mgnify:CR=1 FL=1
MHQCTSQKGKRTRNKGRGKKETERKSKREARRDEKKAPRTEEKRRQEKETKGREDRGTEGAKRAEHKAKVNEDERENKEGGKIE